MIAYSAHRVLRSSYKRCAEEPSVEAKSQDVSEESNERPHNSDLTQCRDNTVAAAQDRGKWDTGRSLRELCPAIFELAAPLGINGNRAAEGQNE